jgi:hypothetical protein
VSGEQGCYFAAQRFITLAGVSEKFRSPFRRVIESGFEQVSDLLPAVGGHGFGGSVNPQV